MKFSRSMMLFALLTLCACAGINPGLEGQEDYVMIDNPASTMSPNAPATIWVPKSYVENGIPRGSEVMKKGYERVVQPVAESGVR